MHGIIEGFYGPPWTWAERAMVCAELAAVGMDTYVYAPKDDPLHRDRWREPYGRSFLDELEALAGSETLRVGFAVSPGLSIDAGSAEDRRALLAKLDSVIERGVSLVGLLLDDLPPSAGLGAEHGGLTRWLRQELAPEVELFMAPLHYTGTVATPYLEQLVAQLPAEVPIAWTGPHVVNDEITVADADAWSQALGGRRPLLWDNTPVNDLIMDDRLFLGPLTGRDPELPQLLAGYLANPMVQARASVAPLRSAAAWLMGSDAQQEWRSAIGAAAVLAEACEPRRLVSLCDRAISGDAAAARELGAFFDEASVCSDGGLGDGVQPWVDQVRAEASVARLALEALTEDEWHARQAATILLLTWPPLRTSGVSVFGGRGGMRPMMDQDRDSRWVPAPGALVPPASIVDRLVQAAFARL